MIPDDLRVYAIGDIHGRADLLRRMGELIAHDLERTPIDDALTVCLGDYIDRGPGSAAVVEQLAHGPWPTALVALKGNHEDLFLRFLDGGLDLDRFLTNGGDATLRSYGLDPFVDLVLKADADMIGAVRAVVPAAHRAWIKSLPTHHTVGNYFFCHAGARPGVPLDAQADHDLMWIRETFLRSTHDFGRTIVHGHTPVRTPDVRRNGINIDTAAFSSGVLTGLALEGTTRRFIQARL